MVQQQISSIPGLDSFSKENPEALGDVQRVIKAMAARRLSLGAEPGIAGELDRLVPMVPELVDIVVSM